MRNVQPKEYGNGFIVSKSLLAQDRTRAFYTRGGKTFIRNYHRILKTKEGLSLQDVLSFRYKKAFQSFLMMFQNRKIKDLFPDEE